MLPTTAGFIFPNGEILDSGSAGHCKTAFRYIRERGLLKSFNDSKFDAEDDFLIFYLGAVKVCHYLGRHYLYVPRPHNEYIEEVARLYEKNNYSIKYISIGNTEAASFKTIDLSRKSYNSTVIETPDGYIYNPRRSGD